MQGRAGLLGVPGLRGGTGDDGALGIPGTDGLKGEKGPIVILRLVIIYKPLVNFFH